VRWFLSDIFASSRYARPKRRRRKKPTKANYARRVRAGEPARRAGKAARALPPSVRPPRPASEALLISSVVARAPAEHSDGEGGLGPGYWLTVPANRRRMRVNNNNNNNKKPRAGEIRFVRWSAYAPHSCKERGSTVINLFRCVHTHTHG